MSDQNHPKDGKERPLPSIAEVLAELLTSSVEADDSQKTRWGILCEPGRSL